LKKSKTFVLSTGGFLVAAFVFHQTAQTAGGPGRTSIASVAIVGKALAHGVSPPLRFLHPSTEVVEDEPRSGDR